MGCHPTSSTVRERCALVWPFDHRQPPPPPPRARPLRRIDDSVGFGSKTRMALLWIDRMTVPLHGRVGQLYPTSTRIWLLGWLSEFLRAQCDTHQSGTRPIPPTLIIPLSFVNSLNYFVWFNSFYRTLVFAVDAKLASPDASHSRSICRRSPFTIVQRSVIIIVIVIIIIIIIVVAVVVVTTFDAETAVIIARVRADAIAFSSCEETAAEGVGYVQHVCASQGGSIPRVYE